LTFPKAVVLILKHASSLRLSMSYGLALIQADLDYQKAHVDKKIQRHIMASQGSSAELDRSFIMAIGKVCLLCLFRSCKTLISNFRCDECVWLSRIVFGTGILTYDTVMLV